MQMNKTTMYANIYVTFDFNQFKTQTQLELCIFNIYINWNNILTEISVCLSGKMYKWQQRAPTKFIVAPQFIYVTKADFFLLNFDFDRTQTERNWTKLKEIKPNQRISLIFDKSL